MHVHLVNGHHVVFRKGLPVRTALNTTLRTSDPDLAEAIADEDEESLPGVASPVSLMLLQATYLDFGSITPLEDLRDGLAHHLENDFLATTLCRKKPFSTLASSLALPKDDVEAWWTQCLTSCSRRALTGLTVAAASTGSAVLGWLMHIGTVSPRQASDWFCTRTFVPSPRLMRDCFSRRQRKNPSGAAMCVQPSTDRETCPVNLQLEKIRWFSSLIEES